MPQTNRYNYISIPALLLFAYCVFLAVGLEEVSPKLSSSKKVEGEGESGRSFSSWLTDQGLEAYEKVFYAVGCTLDNCGHDIDMTNNAFGVLEPAARAKVKQGILQLQNRTVLLQWLQRIGLNHCFESFVAGGYVNVSKLRDLGLGPQPEDLKISAEDYAVIKADAKRRNAMWREKEQVEDKRSCFAHWNVLILLFIIPFLYLRKGLYKMWDKKNFVDPLKSKITWGWEDGQVVGRMENFIVEFFYGWGSSYTVTADEVSAEINVGSQAVPFQIERCENQQNAVKVSFTTRQSGVYYFNIRIRNKLISAKPYKKEFLPGNIAPSKSNFVNHSSTIVVCKNEMHPLHLEVCDEYGNVCKERISLRSIKEYSMNVKTLDSTPIEIETPLWDVVVQDDSLLSLFIKIQEPGCFKAVVTYRGQPFSNGEFNIIVLSPDAMEQVNKTVSKKNMDSYYEARLLESNGEKLRKPKKVFCYISPKQLTIKEFYLKIIPKRLHTFRVCPSTKIRPQTHGIRRGNAAPTPVSILSDNTLIYSQRVLGSLHTHVLSLYTHIANGITSYLNDDEFNFQGNGECGEWPEFTIDDGGQDPVTLACESRDILAATYSKFLLKNIGGSETFKTKQEYFYQEVADKHKKSHRTIINLKIDRYSLLESSMKATKSFTTSDWCKKFEIKFLGEEGLDWGGLSREWFGIVCDSLFQSENQLFKSFKNDSQGLVHPNAERPQYMSKLKYFEFAGKIVGKCLYESSLGPSYTQLVRARFSRSFLAQLIGLRVTYKYFETDDPEFFMTKVRYLLDNNIDDLDLGLTFTEEIYNDHGQIDKVVNLKADGESIPVTDSNKIQYLNSLAQYKLSKCVEDEIEAFVKGLNDLIPDTLLSMFDENELELLMCGTSSFDIEDLREHHVAEGWKGAEGHKTLDWFWTVIAGFTQEEMSRLLQFTTGCGQLSSGGFSQLRPNFKIVSIGSHNTLPTAHTCFNQLCLPSYDSIEKLQKSLVIAINEGSTGFGLV